MTFARGVVNVVSAIATDPTPSCRSICASALKLKVAALRTVVSVLKFAARGQCPALRTVHVRGAQQRVRIAHCTGGRADAVLPVAAAPDATAASTSSGM